MFVPWKPSYSRIEAEKAILGARTWHDALDVLGKCYHGKTIATLRKWAAIWSISTENLTDQRGRPGRIRYTEGEARVAIESSFSWAEALRKLGMCHSGGNWLLLKKRAAEWEISSSHFDQYARGREAARRRRLTLEEILVEGSTYSRDALKIRLFESGLKERKCELCGQDEMWRGRAIGLILDHINGVRNDNRLENLRIVCPNCAAGLDTHCGRKNRLSIQERVCQLCAKEFRPRSVSQRYRSQDCGSRAKQPWKPRPGIRRAERPPLHELLRDIDENGYLAVGRRYGVSDNAIRKWVRELKLEESGVPRDQLDSIEVPKRTWPNRKR